MVEVKEVKEVREVKEAMKKKIYIKPEMQIVKIQQHQILCASPDGWGGSDPNNPTDFNAPGFDWVEKGYQFGGWDFEEG